jgi:hypothetical protein
MYNSDNILHSCDAYNIETLRKEFDIDMSDMFPKYGFGCNLLNEKTVTEIKWFYDIIKQHANDSIRIVEVGIRTAEMTVLLCKMCEKVIPDVKCRIYGIDLWEKCDNKNGILGVTFANIIDALSSINMLRHIALMQEDSSTSALLFDDNSVDLVIIDASHEYENVKSDILSWLPKVKKGGYMVCHDIYSPSVPGAAIAVKEIFGDLAPIDKESQCGYHMYKKI